MSVYRNCYRNAAGDLVHSANFSVEFRDHLKLDRKLSTGMTTRASALRFEANLLSLVAALREDRPMPEHVRRWVLHLPEKIAERLTAWKLISPVTSTESRSLAELLERWRSHVASTSTNPAHVQGVYSRAKRVFNACGAATWQDIQPSRVVDACARLGRTCQTRKHYWRAAFQACRYIARHELQLSVAASPLEGHLPKFRSSAADAEFDHPRRALTPDEVGRLLRATIQGRQLRGMSGEYRALVYRLALLTGLRRNEIRTLTAGSFCLDDPTPFVRVSKIYAKSRKERLVPLGPELARDIRVHLMSRPHEPGTAAFPLPQSTAAAMRRDLEAAGIPYRHPDTGEYADFHSLRHTFLTAGCKRNDLKTMQLLAGHASISTTSRYLHSTSEDAARATQSVATMLGC